MLIKDKTVLAAAKIVIRFANEVAQKHNKETNDVLLTAVWICLNTDDEEPRPVAVASRKRGRRRVVREPVYAEPVEEEDDDIEDIGHISDSMDNDSREQDCFNDKDEEISKGLTQRKHTRLNTHVQNISTAYEVCAERWKKNTSLKEVANGDDSFKSECIGHLAPNSGLQNHIQAMSGSKEEMCGKPDEMDTFDQMGTSSGDTNTAHWASVRLEDGSVYKIPGPLPEKDAQSEEYGVDKNREVIDIKEEMNSSHDDEANSSHNIDMYSSAQTFSQEDIFKAADDAAAKVVLQIRDRKRGHYAYYDDETRAKIGRYAVDHGVSRTVTWFDQQFGRKVSESTVRSMRDQYIKLKNKVGAESETLPCSARGAPPKLGELDQEVQQWVSEVRRKGGVVNVRIVMAGIQGIVSKHPDYQKEIITKHYARSLLRRMGFTQKRDNPKNANVPRSLPPDFEAIKQEFLNRANAVISESHIPDSLIINYDHISCSLVPGGDWIETDNGTPTPSKCAMLTILLAITKNGVLLPPQIIYAGKTNRCLPKDVLFPTNWDVTYSDSHVCSELTMMQYIDRIILPYVNNVRHSMPDMTNDQQAMVIFDGNKVNHSWVFLQRLDDCRISPLYVPASCPQHIQPIGLTLCRDYKDSLKDQFHLWYTQEVVLSLAKHSEDSGISSTVDLRSSSLKPRHASWIINTHLQMQNRCEMIRDSFKKAGF